MPEEGIRFEIRQISVNQTMNEQSYPASEKRRSYISSEDQRIYDRAPNFMPIGFNLPDLQNQINISPKRISDNNNVTLSCINPCYNHECATIKPTNPKPTKTIKSNLNKFVNQLLNGFYYDKEAKSKQRVKRKKTQKMEETREIIEREMMEREGEMMEREMEQARSSLEVPSEERILKQKIMNQCSDIRPLAPKLDIRYVMRPQIKESRNLYSDFVWSCSDEEDNNINENNDQDAQDAYYPYSTLSEHDRYQNSYVANLPEMNLSYDSESDAYEDDEYAYLQRSPRNENQNFY